MEIITIILIGLSLSMDAFSLSLLYGSKKIDKKNIYKLSLTVGLFHFFMPLLGHFLGNGILLLVKISSSILMFVILLVVGIEMIIDSFKDDKRINTEQALMFALAVSIDSFSIGLSLKNIVNNLWLSPLIFSMISALLTYLGLKLGGYINKRIGKYSTIIGGIFLIVIALLHIM